MADDRHIAELTALFERACRIGTEMIEHATVGHIGKRERATRVGVVVAPPFTSNTAGGEIIHSCLHALVAQEIVGTKGVELVGTKGAEIIDKTLHGADASTQLVAKSHEDERRMMAIFLEDVDALLVEERHQDGILFVEIAPEREFGLHVDAQAVGSGERSLRGTPGMETNMVDAIVLADTQVPEPFIDRHGHMGLEGPNAGIVLATQKDAMTVGIEMATFDVEVVESRIHLRRTHFGRLVARNEADVADDAVPVGLRVLGVGVAVAVDLFGHTLGVIDQDGEIVTPRGKMAQREALGRGDVVGRSHIFTIHINACQLGAFEDERPRHRVVGHTEPGVVPSWAHVAEMTRKPRGFGLVGTGFTQAIGVGCARQGHSKVVLGTVEAHTPTSGKVDGLGALRAVARLWVGPKTATACQGQDGQPDTKCCSYVHVFGIRYV